MAIKENKPANDLDSLYGKWKQSKSKQDMSDMVEYLQPEINKGIAAAGGKTSYITLGQGKQVTIDAIKSYDPKSGAKLTSWLNTQMQRMIRNVKTTKFTMRVPEAKARDAFDVQSRIADIEAKHGGVISDGALADELGIPLKKLQAYRGAVTPEVITADAPPAEESSTDPQLIMDMVYTAKLSPRDQFIMQHALGYNGNKILPSNVIAQKLKVTPATVSQRLAEIRKLIQRAESAVS